MRDIPTLIVCSLFDGISPLADTQVLSAVIITHRSLPAGQVISKPGLGILSAIESGDAKRIKVPD